MKQKILNALKQEYKNLGVSDGAFDGVASLLTKTITEESGIADGVKDASVSSLLKSIQSDVDKERTEKSRLRAELEKKPQEPTKSEPKSEPNPNDELMKQIKEMREELAGLRADKVHETTSSRIVALLREKKVSDSFIDMAMQGRTFDERCDIERFVAQTAEGYERLKTELADSRFGENQPPESGSGASDPLDELIKEIEEDTKAMNQKQNS